MKRYHLFAGADYYPNGFMDYRGSFETEAEAEEAGIEGGYADWYSVLRTTEDGSLEELYEKRVSRKRK